MSGKRNTLSTAKSVAVLVAFSVLAISLGSPPLLQTTLGQTEPQRGTGSAICPSVWQLGDAATYFVTLHIDQAGGITFEYLRKEVLVWEGVLKHPEPLSIVGEVHLVKRLSLHPAPRSRKVGYTNLAVPPSPYESSDFVDIYAPDRQWFVTALPRSVLQSGGEWSGDWSERRFAKSMYSLPWSSLRWPLEPGHRFMQVAGVDLFIDIAFETVDLGSPLGSLSALVIADRYSSGGFVRSRKSWFSPQFPIAVKREMKFRGSDFRLELVEFSPAGGGARESICR